MSKRTLRFPAAVDEALERVMEGDRTWFKDHPAERWRIRSADPVEWQSHDLMSLFTRDGGCCCRECAPYVLVVRWPIAQARARFFFSGDPFASPSEILPGSVTLLNAQTDEAFVDALMRFVRPAGPRVRP